MASDLLLELQEPEESRPVKRARLEPPVEVTMDAQGDIIDDDEGWDDIYGITKDETPAEEPIVGNNMAGSISENCVSDVKLIPSMVTSEVFEKPSIGSPNISMKGAYLPIEGSRGTGGSKVEDSGIQIELQDGSRTAVPDAKKSPSEVEIPAKSPKDVSGHSQDATLEHSVHVSERQKTTEGEEILSTSSDALKVQDENESGSAQAVEKSETTAMLEKPLSSGLLDILQAHHGSSRIQIKATEDAEFMAAAAAQKEDKNAEWQFDSSDAETSSDSSSDSTSDSSSDSDGDSEGGYEMLDAATAAKILMSGEGDDDEDGGIKKKGGNEGPKTANERKEAPPPKPDVVITEDMKITKLGIIERMVEDIVLIKGITPGEYQVLESGSVLCNEKREVIGVVAETLGRVQEPMYSVTFGNAQEIQDAGLECGMSIYYVDAHSTFVFTQPLKNLRGTDASNIHDEEVGEDDIEFSDDEAEAEYKRQKKMAKKSGRSGITGANAVIRDGEFKSFGAPGHDSGLTYVSNDHGDAPRQSYGGGLSYDDDEPAEEFYSPLKRPDNLSEMMASGGPPRPQQGQFERGRGRGRGDRGRGRGDRGRGRGSFHPHERNHRGGHGGGQGGQANGSSHKGPAQSFPDRHNTERTNGNRQNFQQSRPNPQKPSSPPHPQPHASWREHPPAHDTNQHLPPIPQQAQSYQFNGYTFQYGNNPLPQQPKSQQQLQGYNHQSNQQHHPPSGSTVNPSFYQNQQLALQQQDQNWLLYQQQQQVQFPLQQPPQAYQTWTGGQPPAYASGTAPTQQQQQNLADILRRIGGG